MSTVARSHLDAIVVGAGVAGAATAVWLARAGWSVALVEKQAFPRRKVCGECIAASNLPLLDALGVAPAAQPGCGAELRRAAAISAGQDPRGLCHGEHWHPDPDAHPAVGGAGVRRIVSQQQPHQHVGVNCAHVGRACAA